MMIEQIIVPLQVPFNCAVIAIVWVFALTEDIFDFVPRLVNNATSKMNVYWADKIRAITYGCEKCIAGQIALWYGLFSDQYSIYNLYSIFDFFILIMYSILIAMVIAKYLNR